MSETESLWERDKRRVRLALSDGHMDVCLSPEASPETVEALRSVGEAALVLMREETADGE
jgi:hypothetical protein